MLTSLMSRRPGKVPEMFGEQAPPAEYPRLDGSDWYVESLGYGLEGEAFEVAEYYCNPELGCQSRQGSFEVGAKFDRLENILASGVGRIGGLGQRLSLMPAGLAKLVVASIDGDPVQPGAEGGSPRELLHFAVDGDESLLDGIKGSFSICEDPQTNCEHPIFMGSHELIEGTLIAGEKRGDQLGILPGAETHGRKRTSARDA
jgi:hypothetical protein